MNEEYLWDQSGEPDPEVQELERVLGTLRFQPRPIEIPHVSTQRNPFFLRGLAIAAAVAMIALGLTVWRSMNRQPKVDAAHTVNPVNQTKPDETKQAALPVIDDQKRANIIATTTTTERRRVRNRVKPQPRPLTATEIAAARTAKHELMLALKVASEKLSFAQKKVQPEAPAPVQNQHKIG